MNKLWSMISVKREANGLGKFEYSTSKWCSGEECMFLEALWTLCSIFWFVLMLGMVSYDSSTIAVIGFSFYTIAWLMLTPIYHDIIHGYDVVFKPIF